MNRKIVKPVALGVGAVVVVGIAAIVTGLSYVTSAGDQTLWSVRLMKKSGFEDYIARRAQEKANRDD